jgi:hypothetical protein
MVMVKKAISTLTIMPLKHDVMAKIMLFLAHIFLTLKLNLLISNFEMCFKTKKNAPTVTISELDSDDKKRYQQYHHSIVA